MLDTLLLALGGGLVQGLVIWGGLRSDQRAMRRDIDRHEHRIDVIDARCMNEARLARIGRIDENYPVHS